MVCFIANSSQEALLSIIIVPGTSGHNMNALAVTFKLQLPNKLDTTVQVSSGNYLSFPKPGQNI